MYKPRVFALVASQTYTATDQALKFSSTDQVSGNTPVTVTNNSGTVSFSATGIYLIAISATWKSNVAARSQWGHYVIKVDSELGDMGTMAGSANVQYMRWNTYGEYSSSSSTFAVRIGRTQEGLRIRTKLASGTANHTTQGGDLAGAITVIKISEI